MTGIRQVRPEEHDEVARLTLAAYDAVGRVSDEYRHEVADVAGRLDQGTQVLVAVVGGDVVGSVTMVAGSSRHFEHVGHGDGGFRMLAVAPAAQGTGVGRALLAAAVRHGTEAGWRRLAITTMEWMHGAQRLYDRAGFTRRADLDVRYPSGTGLAYVLDLTADADAHFPPPGPVPDEPPWYEHVHEAPGC